MIPQTEGLFDFLNAASALQEKVIVPPSLYKELLRVIIYDCED